MVARKTIPSERRCIATHNPGRWPYVARCVKNRKHRGKHEDQFGGVWESTPADAAFDEGVDNP